MYRYVAIVKLAGNYFCPTEVKVGFKEFNHTVGESAGTVEVCVVVISPPPTDDLDVTVLLSPTIIDGTANHQR